MAEEGPGSVTLRMRMMDLEAKLKQPRCISDNQRDLIARNHQLMMKTTVAWLLGFATGGLDCFYLNQCLIDELERVEDFDDMLAFVVAGKSEALDLAGYKLEDATQSDTTDKLPWSDAASAVAGVVAASAEMDELSRRCDSGDEEACTVLAAQVEAKKKCLNRLDMLSSTSAGDRTPTAEVYASEEAAKQAWLEKLNAASTWDETTTARTPASASVSAEAAKQAWLASRETPSWGKAQVMTPTHSQIACMPQGHTDAHANTASRVAWHL